MTNYATLRSGTLEQFRDAIRAIPPASRGQVTLYLSQSQHNVLCEYVRMQAGPIKADPAIAYGIPFHILPDSHPTVANGPVLSTDPFSPLVTIVNLPADSVFPDAPLTAMTNSDKWRESQWNEMQRAFSEGLRERRLDDLLLIPPEQRSHPEGDPEPPQQTPADASTRLWPAGTAEVPAGIHFSISAAVSPARDMLRNTLSAQPKPQPKQPIEPPPSRKFRW